MMKNTIPLIVFLGLISAVSNASAAFIVAYAESPGAVNSTLTGTQVFDFNSTPLGRDVNVSWSGEGFQIRLPGQPESIALFAYGPTSSDRHHTMKVCLKYRGTELEPVASEGAVWTDGSHWLREYFLRDQSLMADYGEYLSASFLPGSTPGTHLIFAANRDAISPAKFEAACKNLAIELAKRCRPAAPNLIARRL